MATILNIYRRRGKTLSVKEYLNKFRSYLKDTINDLKKSSIQNSIVHGKFN